MVLEKEKKESETWHQERELCHYPELTIIEMKNEQNCKVYRYIMNSKIQVSIQRNDFLYVIMVGGTLDLNYGNSRQKIKKGDRICLPESEVLCTLEGNGEFLTITK